MRSMVISSQRISCSMLMSMFTVRTSQYLVSYLLLHSRPTIRFNFSECIELNDPRHWPSHRRTRSSVTANSSKATKLRTFWLALHWASEGHGNARECSSLVYPILIALSGAIGGNHEPYIPVFTVNDGNHP